MGTDPDAEPAIHRLIRTLVDRGCTCSGEASVAKDGEASSAHGGAATP
jgi:hypothetical protein